MRIPKRVAVIGAGSMGSQAMWRLAARGAEVIGYDRYAPGHDRGAAGGESRIFRAAHLGEPGYIPLLRLADGLWEQLQAETGRSLRRRSGCLVMGETASPEMRQLLSSSATHRLDHEVMGREDLAAATRSTVSRTDTPPSSTARAPSSGPRRRSRPPPPEPSSWAPDCTATPRCGRSSPRREAACGSSPPRARTTWTPPW